MAPRSRRRDERGDLFPWERDPDEGWDSMDFDDTDPDGVEADMLEYYEMQEKLR